MTKAEKSFLEEEMLSVFPGISRLKQKYKPATIKQLKKELGLSQKDLAGFFDMSYGAFANSTAKERYENALCRFYEVVKSRE